MAATATTKADAYLPMESELERGNWVGLGATAQIDLVDWKRNQNSFLTHLYHYWTGKAYCCILSWKCYTKNILSINRLPQLRPDLSFGLIWCKNTVSGRRSLVTDWCTENRIYRSGAAAIWNSDLLPSLLRSFILRRTFVEREGRGRGKIEREGER